MPAVLALLLAFSWAGGCDGCSEGGCPSGATCEPDGGAGGGVGGGGAGGGGTGGGTGGGGAQDGGEPPLYCDDGNACTVDSIDGSGCRFDPVRDGTICEDGDLCTLGDRCHGGQCVSGDPAAGALSLIGHLDNLSGAHVPMGSGRFVTVTREDVLFGRVQLVARTASGLDALAAWEGRLNVGLSAWDTLAHASAASGVVAIAARSYRDVRLFSVSEVEIVPRGQVELSGQIVSMIGHGDRLWLCIGNFLTGYGVALVDVSDPDLPVEVGLMPLAAECGSIAVSEDGERVYVNTSEGVRYVDAAPLDVGGDPTLSGVIAESAGVNVSGSHLVLTRPTGVSVLIEADHAEVVVVPAAGPRAAALFGGRLLVEGDRAVGGASESYVAWYDALGASGPRLLDEVVLRTYGPSPAAASFRSATDGTALMVGARMFDLGADKLDEVSEPALVPTAILARTNEGVRAYVPLFPTNAATIDVVDLASPSFVAAGSLGIPAAGWARVIAIDESLPIPAFVAGLGTNFDDSTRVPLYDHWPSTLTVRRWTLDAGAALQSADSFSLPHEGEAQMVVAGDFAYALREAPTPSSLAELRGYWLPGGGKRARAAHGVFRRTVLMAISPPRAGQGVHAGYTPGDPGSCRLSP